MIDEHGEEEDEKTKRDLDILKKYHKKEIKSVKKIFITLFLIFALVYIVKLLMGFFYRKGKILCQKELNLEKNQKEKDKDKKRGIRVTYFLLCMVRD